MWPFWVAINLAGVALLYAWRVRQLQPNERRLVHPCRHGGEEFAVVLGDTGAEGAAAVAEFIRSGVESLGVAHEDAPGGIVTVSVGIGTREAGEYGGPGALMEACDRALSEAKKLGRNRTCTATAQVLD